MERPNLMSSIGKIKDKYYWNSTIDFSSNHYIPSSEISWDVKKYACSFCKRQFKSAQALGGHMNVHRRERARLRLLSSSLPECSYNNPNPNPNPNPSYSSLSSPSSTTLSSAKFLATHHNYTPHNSLLSPSLPSLSLPNSASAFKDKKLVFDFIAPSNNLIPLNTTPQGCRDTNVMKNNCNMRAVLEGGDHSKRFEQKDHDHPFVKAMKKDQNINIRLDLEMGLLKGRKEDDVDLELRLGYF